MVLHDGMNRCQAYTLYLNHTLSTWNARSYAFAALVFTAFAYPEGLRAASLIGVSTSLAAICFGSAIGRWIDHGTSRLRTLLATIAINRCSIIAACLLWFFIVGDQPSKDPTTQSDGEASGSTAILQGTMKTVAFSLLLLLGIIESLSRKANVISIERDWVPILAPVTTPGGYTLTHVNSMMARVDMICKLIAPITVSWFLSIVSTRVGVVVMALTNGISFTAELWSAGKLWNQCPQLSQKKIMQAPGNSHDPTIPNGFSLNSSMDKASTLPASFLDSLKLYFGSSVCAPSLAMCVTHASILSITSITVVFLLDSGYSLQLVTAGEAISALFELSSTLFVPLAVRRIMAMITPSAAVELEAMSEEEEDPESLAKSPVSENRAQLQIVDVAISRVGLSGILSMALVLLPAVPILLYLTHVLQYPLSRTPNSPTFAAYPMATLILFFCLASSRLGHGMFSLSTQQLAQSRLPPHQRSSFAGTETAFVSMFGLAHSLGTTIWSKPAEFGWLAFGSWIMVASSATMYVYWWMRENARVRHWEGWRFGQYSSLSTNE